MVGQDAVAVGVHEAGAWPAGGQARGGPVSVQVGVSGGVGQAKGVRQLPRAGLRRSHAWEEMRRSRWLQLHLFTSCCSPGCLSCFGAIPPGVVRWEAEEGAVSV